MASQDSDDDIADVTDINKLEKLRKDWHANLKPTDANLLAVGRLVVPHATERTLSQDKYMSLSYERGKSYPLATLW
jgi:hypothetical protein